MMALFTYQFSIAEEAFKKDNVKLQTLCDYSYLLSAALNKKTISENQLEDLETWRNNPSNWTPKEDYGYTTFEFD